MDGTLEVIYNFQFENLSSDEWNLFLDFYYPIFKELFPFEPYDRNVEKIQFLNGFPNTERRIWVIKEKREFLAYAILLYYTKSDPAYEQNKDLTRSFVFVHPRKRRNKLGTYLFNEIVQYAVIDSKRYIVCNTSASSGWFFLEKFNGHIVLTSTESALDLTLINWNLIQEWKIEGLSKNQGILIETFNTIPESLLERYVDLELNILSNIPRDNLRYEEKTSKETIRKYEKDFSEKNIIIMYKLARDHSDELMGVTIARYNPATPEVIEQGLTGVSKRYRGRGLGRLLKADMLIDIRKNLPNVKSITTATSTLNAPMLKINTELGYKLVSTWKHYEFNLSELLQILKKKNEKRSDKMIT